MEEVTQAITQMASHSDLTDEMKYCGHVEVAAFLLRHPDINKKKMCWNFLSGEAMPALECTLASQCREGVEGPKMVNMEKMMKLLFENGADATALDAEGDSMLENAAKRFYNGEIKHDLQVHARKVVQYLAEDIGLPVTEARRGGSREDWRVSRGWLSGSLTRWRTFPR